MLSDSNDKVLVPSFGSIVLKKRAKLLEEIEELKIMTDWRPGEDVLPRTPNYVTNSTLGVSFKLKDIVLQLSNSYYKPEEFAAVTLKLWGSACLVFENGNIVTTGLTSGNDVKYGQYQYRLQLMNVKQMVKVLNNDGTPMTASEDELEQPVNSTGVLPKMRPDVRKELYTLTTMEKLMEFKNYSVVNVVGSGKGSAQPIDLSLFSNIMTTSRSEWEPEIFPAIKYQLTRKYCPLSVPKCTAHIFDSGAMVFMGATCQEDVINGFLFLKCIIKQFVDRKANYQNISDKFKYRLNQINETNDKMKHVSQLEKAQLELSILQDASTKCFGDYMTTEALKESTNNPLKHMSDHISTTESPGMIHLDPPTIKPTTSKSGFGGKNGNNIKKESIQNKKRKRTSDPNANSSVIKKLKIIKEENEKNTKKGNLQVDISKNLKNFFENVDL